ncbi:MAG: DCC1-like thiol-disulfide oxidoreductase family protein [Myxococcaceae bacterium]
MNEKLTVYYDGSCGFCCQQVHRIDSEDTQRFLELKGTNHSPYLYVQDESGQLFYGVDAFAKIWKITGHPILSWLCQAPISKQIAWVIYRLIAKYRHIF